MSEEEYVPADKPVSIMHQINHFHRSFLSVILGAGIISEVMHEVCRGLPVFAVLFLTPALISLTIPLLFLRFGRGHAHLV